MKTITEYHPMIFSQMAEQAEQRIAKRRRLVSSAVMVCGYSAIGLFLGLDTGLAPWQWQFWIMFLPLFVAGELVVQVTTER